MHSGRTGIIQNAREKGKAEEARIETHILDLSKGVLQFCGGERCVFILYLMLVNKHFYSITRSQEQVKVFHILFILTRKNISPRRTPYG